MADYFFLLDADFFEGAARPALARSWRERSFAPCVELCRSLVPAARDYRERYHVGESEPLVNCVSAGISFDRTTWRFLISEVLLFGAAEIPEIQTCPITLTCLLAPEYRVSATHDRQALPPIQQAHFGSRDLTFGSAVFRPEQAGYNNAADVARIADYLEAIQPDLWKPDDLATLPDLPAEDREEELAFARDWFPLLAELFVRAQSRRQVIVHESIY